MININFLKGKSFPLRRVLPFVAIALFLGISGYLGYDYYKTQQELSQFEQSEQAVAIKERDELLEKVGKIALLPQDEDPTIATVADAFRLRGQKFFSRAENNDKVIIFPQSQRAILYRPSTGKIIESAPINISDLEGTVSRTQTAQQENQGEVAGEQAIQEDGTGEAVLDEPDQIEPAEPAKLAIYNGTLYVEGLATKVGAYLVKEIPGNTISVEILKNAEDIYEETLIIDVTQRYYDVAEEIREILNGTIEPKPQDVQFPDVDIVIIAGTDLSEEDLE